MTKSPATPPVCDAREIAYQTGLKFMVRNPDYARNTAASMKRLTDSIVEVLSHIPSEEAREAAIQECINAITAEGGRVFESSNDIWRGGMFHAAETLSRITSAPGAVV